VTLAISAANALFYQHFWQSPHARRLLTLPPLSYIRHSVQFSARFRKEEEEMSEKFNILHRRNAAEPFTSRHSNRCAYAHHGLKRRR
jgi:hypothetical protein